MHVAWMGGQILELDLTVDIITACYGRDK